MLRRPAPDPMRALLPLLLLATAAASGQTPLPVTFLPGGASDEGCYAQWVTTSAVRAYSAPSEQSRHVRTVDADRRIDANDYSESLTAVLEPGLVRANRDVVAVGRELRNGQDRTFRLTRGDEVVLLSSGSAGALTLSVDGVVFVGSVDGLENGSGDVDVARLPVLEVWLRLIEHGPGRPAAWVNTALAGMVPNEPFCE